MELTHSSGDQEVRMDAFAKMQKILFDDVVMIPTHQSSIVYLQDRRLKRLVRYPVTDYSMGRISR